MVKANNPLHNISINTAIKIFGILRTKLPDAKSRLGLVCLGLVGFKLSIVKLFFWCNCVTPKLYRLGQVQYAPLQVRLGLFGHLCRLDQACLGMHLTYSVWGWGKFSLVHFQIFAFSKTISTIRKYRKIAKFHTKPISNTYSIYFKPCNIVKYW